MPIRIRDAVPDDAPSLASIYAYYVDHTPITFEISPAPGADEMRKRVEEGQRLHVFLVAEYVTDAAVEDSAQTVTLDVPVSDELAASASTSAAAFSAAGVPPALTSTSTSTLPTTATGTTPVPTSPQPTILGYAHASPLNPRAAYRWSCYTGIYLSPSSLSPSDRRKGLGTLLYTTLISRLEQRGYRQLFALVTQPNHASNALHAKLGFEQCGVLKRSGWKTGKWWDVWWFQKSIGRGEGDEEPAEIRLVQEE